MRLWRSTAFRAICVIAAATAIAGSAVIWAESRDATPSCSWPLQVRGTATPTQAALVRCYLQALADHDAGELGAVARDIPPAHITGGLFSYSHDARAGLAAATFTPSPVDSTYVLVAIKYANGTTENTGMLNMIAMGGPSTWRMDIGQPGELPGQ